MLGRPGGASLLPLELTYQQQRRALCLHAMPACSRLQDVDTYTQGWPPSRTPGQPDMFKRVKRALPGPVSRPAASALV